MITKEIFAKSLTGMTAPQLWELFEQTLKAQNWYGHLPESKPERNAIEEGRIKLEVLNSIVTALDAKRARKLFAENHPELQERVRDANDHSDVTL